MPTPQTGSKCALWGGEEQNNKNDTNRTNNGPTCVGCGGHHKLSKYNKTSQTKTNKIWLGLNAGPQEWGNLPEKDGKKDAIVNTNLNKDNATSTAAIQITTGTSSDTLLYRDYTNSMARAEEIQDSLELDIAMLVGVHEVVNII